MKKHKYILLIVICIFFLLLVLLIGATVLLIRKSAGQSVIPVAIEMLPVEKQPVEPRKPEGEIVLISRHVNYAWGYNDAGIFVDSAGYVYTFDFSAENIGYGGRGDLLEKLELLRRWENPVAHVAPAEVDSFVKRSRKISDYDTFREKSLMCDYGEKQLLFCDPDTPNLLVPTATSI